MKRINLFGAFISLIAAFAILAGCSKSQSADSTNSTPTEQHSTPAAPQPASVELRGGISCDDATTQAALELKRAGWTYNKALGGTVNPRTQFNYAIQLSAEHSRTNLLELSENKTPVSWSKESRAIAIESGYLRGNLKGSKQKENAPALPDGYTLNLKPIAERRGALAGYRLADEIKSLPK